MRFGHRCEQGDEFVAGDGGGVADTQGLGLAASDVPGAAQGGAGHAVEDTGVLDQGRSGGQRGDARAAALQQRDSDFAFEGPDGGGQGLLGQVEPGGCAGEAAFLGDGDQVVEFVQVQAHLNASRLDGGQ
ncbi:hypothetical protein GCM10020256_10680 [Streptomyces thermocoprophilus]